MAALVWADALSLQARDHVERKAFDPLRLPHVTGMENERFAEEIRKLRLELPERGVPHALAALDLNGAYVVLPRELRFRNKEIDLHPLFPVVWIGTRVEVQFAPGCDESLRDDVLHEHPLVDGQIARHKPLVDGLGRKFVLIEGMAHEKSRIRHVAFERRMVCAQRQPKIRLGRVVAEIAYHGVLEPERGLLVFSHPRIDVYVRKIVGLLVPRQLRGDGVPHAFHLERT